MWHLCFLDETNNKVFCHIQSSIVCYSFILKKKMRYRLQVLIKYQCTLCFIVFMKYNCLLSGYVRDVKDIYKCFKNMFQSASSVIGSKTFVGW